MIWDIIGNNVAMSQFATLFAIMSQIYIIRVKSLVLFSVKSQKTLCHNDFFDIICDGYGGYTGGTGGCPPVKVTIINFFWKFNLSLGVSQLDLFFIMSQNLRHLKLINLKNMSQKILRHYLKLCLKSHYVW